MEVARGKLFRGLLSPGLCMMVVQVATTRRKISKRFPDMILYKLYITDPAVLVIDIHKFYRAVL